MRLLRKNWVSHNYSKIIRLKCFNTNYSVLQKVVNQCKINSECTVNNLSVRITSDMPCSEGGAVG